MEKKTWLYPTAILWKTHKSTKEGAISDIYKIKN